MALPLGQEVQHLPSRVKDVIVKARTSWLKNGEVLDILQNYKAYRFPIGKEAPNCPGGGCLFLFNRKAVRFFRKDGHEWRKKADGKTVRETHEKLKIGNKDVLNCYYAHAEAKEALQRRCYWLLEGEGNIVLVHYLSAQLVARLALPPNPSSPQTSDFTEGNCSVRMQREKRANNLCRAISAPINFGNEASAAFTVTTGERLRHVPDFEEVFPTELRDQLGLPEDSLQPVDSVFGGELGMLTSDFFSRAASTPVIPTVAPLPILFPLSDHLDRAHSIGPLHSAPSFSAGTVQTGSTLGANAPGRQQDSLTSTQTGPFSLAFPPEPSALFHDTTSPLHRSCDPFISSPLSTSSPLAPSDLWNQPPASKPWENLLQPELPPTAFELKPTSSLTRVDSDTLKVAPSLSKATSGSGFVQMATAESPLAALPKSTFSPFYAAAFSGNPIRDFVGGSERSQCAASCHTLASAQSEMANRLSLKLPRSMPSEPLTSLTRMETERLKKHRSNEFGAMVSAAERQQQQFSCDGSKLGRNLALPPRSTPQEPSRPPLECPSPGASLENHMSCAEAGPSLAWMASSSKRSSDSLDSILGNQSFSNFASCLDFSGQFGKVPKKAQSTDLTGPITNDFDWELEFWGGLSGKRD